MGVERNPAEAMRWCQEAAKQHYATGEFLLGTMYETGVGTAPDISQAARWYRKAVDQGNSQAENNLAVLYEEGAGVPQDINEAIRLYELSAEKGDGNGYMNLAQLYAGKKGHAPDYSQAYFWALLAQRSGWVMSRRQRKNSSISCATIFLRSRCPMLKRR